MDKVEKEKKVGLLTYHDACNFGANLQALSTIGYFRNKGISIEVINWSPNDLQDYYSRMVIPSQRKEHSEFVNAFLPISSVCRTSEDVADLIIDNGYTDVIVGSDAVFSYKPILSRIHLSRRTGVAMTKVTKDHQFPNPFWGDFKTVCPNVKLFAMSASAQYLDFGRCLPFEKKRLKSALERFDYISVRDRWTKKIVESFINKDVDISPDPVFGLAKNIRSLNLSLSSRFRLPENYVLLSFCSYVYPKEWFEELYKELKDNKFFVVNLAMPEGCVDIPADMKINVPLSPVDWYLLIKNSKGYIGQRMHPMVVALSNIVPFVSFDHYAYKKDLCSSKIFDLLERANLLDNYVTIGRNEIEAKDVVSKILQFDKDKAASFVLDYENSYSSLMEKITDRL